MEKALLWFGNHGAAHGDFGMLTLLPLLPSLISVAKRVPIKLVIVSNSAEKFECYFANLPFATEYREWHPLKIFDHVEAADVCLIPNSCDSFSLTKSPNRAVLALHHGTPVVATKTPALDEFAHCIAFDSWETGILSYLSDKERVQRDVANGHALINSKYALPVIARRWADLIARHLATAS